MRFDKRTLAAQLGAMRGLTLVLIKEQPRYLLASTLQVMTWVYQCTHTIGCDVVVKHVVISVERDVR